MMIVRTVLSLFVLIGTLQPLSAAAEVVKYRDESGKIFYVDNPLKVPEKYRGQLKDQPQLPEISRIQTGREQLFEKEHYALLPQAQKVDIFVTSWCPYCKELERFLNQNKIQYTRYDIEQDSRGRRIHEQLGGGGVPVIRIGHKIIRGFDRDSVGRALGLVN
jgi:glutaredoxin